MENNLIPISPAKYGELKGITKATVCNRLRSGDGLPDAVKVDRMGNRWIIYVPAEMLKQS
jgi:sugar lactone lactonase YvrE